MKIVIPGLVVFALWSWLCVRWYVCGIHELCEDTPALVEQSDPEIAPQLTDTLASVEEPEPAALSFDWSGWQPQIGPSYQDFEDSLILVFDEDPGAIVEITGIYDPQELNDSDFSNLGLARAQAVKDLLLTSGIKRAININAQTEDLSSYLGNQIRNGVSIALTPAVPMEGFAVVREGNKLTIHFPSDSENPRIDAQVLQSLRNLAQEAKDKGLSILVVGHTDSPGDAQKNRILGLKRASSIKDILLEAGLNDTSVLAESEGEDHPIANNATAKGRRLNRRVELVII